MAEADWPERRWRVKTLLKKIASQVECEAAPGLHNGCRVLGAYWGERPRDDVRRWFFDTKRGGLLASYSEYWQPVRNSGKLHLRAACLTLYRYNASERCEEEILAVHCEPMYAENSCKRGPHLHIEKAEHPIPRAHFPLNAGHLAEVLTSIESLTAALGTTLSALESEVLALYEKR